MKRKSTPGDRSPGVFGSLTLGGDEKTLVPLLCREFKNLTPTSSRYSRSKRENVSRTDYDYGIGRMAAGQSCSEIDVYDHSFSRYRRADSVSVLREIHRRYPKNTELILVKGLWTLVPVRSA